MTEAQLIASIVDRVLARIGEADPRQVIVGISNRHVHLSDADFQRKTTQMDGPFAFLW